MSTENLPQSDPAPFITLDNGVVVKFRRVNKMRMGMVQKSFKMPERPKYMVKTASGKEEWWPMDAQVAAETPGDAAKWEAYTEQRSDIEDKHNTAIMNVIFVYGTSFRIPEDDTEWMSIYTQMGAPVPTDEDVLKVDYLMYHITDEQLEHLVKTVTSMSGVSEESIQIAEDSFRDPVHNGQGTGPIVVAGGHTQEATGHQLATRDNV